MTILHSNIFCFTTANTCNDIEVELFYPKILIIQNKNTLYLLNIQKVCQEQITTCLHKIDVDNEIIHKCTQGYCVWLLLKSKEVIVVNIETESKIYMSLDKMSICEVHASDNNIIFVSESGDAYMCSYTKEEIEHNFKEGIADLTLSLSKLHARVSDLVSYNHLIWKELEVCNIMPHFLFKCPVSGVFDKLTIDESLHILPWGEFVLVVKPDCNSMWIIDLKNDQLSYTFPNLGMKYYPVKVHNNHLFYITWKENEINIYCAWNENITSTQSNNDISENSFARLSSQETLQQHLNSLIEIAIHDAKPDQVKPDIIKLFDQIDDVAFLIDVGVKLCHHNLEYKSILYSIQNRLSQNTLCSTDLYNKLSDVIIKIDLLEYMCFKGNSSYDWIDIYDKNFIELCIEFISNSDLDVASICWLKYINLKLNAINSNDVNGILNAIPYNIKMSSLIIWLKNLVPPLLNENPFYVDYFVKWTIERVFRLEQSGYWPKIGLKFLEEIILVLETSLKTVTVRPISMDDLDSLKDCMNYIIELKDKYRINMLLNELNSQTPGEIALIMLRRCYTEDLNIFLHEYLPSYAARHLFELDDILRTYVEREAAVSGGGIDGPRLKIILNSFRSTTTKLNSLLQVLKVLDVPWDSNVLDLAIDAASSPFKDFTVTEIDHTLAVEVQKELIYARVKVVLKKYNFPLSCNDYVLVLDKVTAAESVNLLDLNIVTTVMSHSNNYGTFLYIDRCLRDCETRTALKYFSNLSPKDKNILLKAALNKYEQIIHSEKRNAAFEKNYIDFLKGTKHLTDHQIFNVEQLYHLKNTYNINMCFNNLYNEANCYENMLSWMRENGNTPSSLYGEYITRLTSTYQSRHSIIINLLRQTNANKNVRNFLENLLQLNKEEKFGTKLDSLRDGCNAELLLESFYILTRLISFCDEDNLHILCHNLSTLNALINCNILLQNLSVAWKFQYIYLPMSSMTGMNDLINFIENILDLENPTSFMYTIQERYDFIPIKMMSFLLNSQSINQHLSDDFYIVRRKIIRKLLFKIISCHSLDEILLTCLLIILARDYDDSNDSWFIETLKSQYETIPPSISSYLLQPLIRKTFNIDGSLRGTTATFPPQYLLKTKFNIDLADIALPDNSEETWDTKVLIFYVLRQFPDTSFDRIAELCHTFDVSVNDGLILQMLSLLSTWDLKYKLFYDDLNCRQIHYENDDTELQAKCLIIWESIENKDLLMDILKDLWKNGEVSLHGRLVSINPYYYEVYLCIYHFLYGSSFEIRNIKEFFILQFLKVYKRKSTPKQYEFELFSVKGMFPEVGYFRLPFHLFMREDMWSNLKSEITLDTYERWLPVVSLLCLDSDIQTARDMICSNALKQTMTSRKCIEGSEVEYLENERWRLITKEESLLRTAHKCVKHIANMEWAGACLFYVLQGCSRGADQVAAAQLCYQFAQRWATVQPGNRAVRQMERIHSSLSTRHALHKIGWACEELVRLSTEPAQLIRALYLHPNFVDKIYRYDVNRTANEIADKNGINISLLRNQILENILSKPPEENKKSPGLDSTKLKTAKYILKATCPKMAAIYLSRIAFDDESDINKCKKLRALQCLISIIEVDTAVKVTNRDRETLWNSLIELIHIVNLENIDMPWVVATFLQDKSKAVGQLVQASSNNIVLKIAATLARKYGNNNIICNLIALLLRAELYEEMVPLLLKLSAPPNELIYKAWRVIILSPFRRADYPITERQKHNCIKAINLLPVCPAIHDEDLIEIWKNCVRCKCFGVGCLVLPYITPEKRQQLNELFRIDKRNLIASLKNLHTETYLISGAMYVVENLLSKIKH
ncbi:hypothetical protein ACJJTC_002825 [Scirpophaga incertulas]